MFRKQFTIETFISQRFAVKLDNNLTMYSKYF